MKKRFKGFTLIELIVVIAIIGVLAAILVPAMMGWVVKSRITTDNNNASEVCAQLQTLLTDLSTNKGVNISNHVIVATDSGVTVDPMISDPVTMAEIAMINSYLTDTSGCIWAAHVVDNEVKAVTYSTNSCRQVGGFPIQCPNSGKLVMSDTSIENYISCAAGSASWGSKASN